MRKRDLVRAINQEFERAGKKHSWIHDRFLDLYTKEQLANFRIFDINWFKGAADIMRYVSMLHDIQTSREDFLAMADLMGIAVEDGISKKRLSELVKERKDWRVYARKVEMWKQEQRRFKEWNDLYIFLKERGMETALLPTEVEDGRWSLEVLEEGQVVKLQLTEWSDGLEVERLRGMSLESIGMIERQDEDDMGNLLLL